MRLASRSRKAGLTDGDARQHANEDWICAAFDDIGVGAQVMQELHLRPCVADRPARPSR
jgi:hypothetical protein